MIRRSECACGQVSAVVEGEPANVLMCHCDYCQRRTGSVFNVSCYYPKERVSELNGETKVFSDSTNSIGIQYNFCPHCGTTVYWTYGEAMERNFPGMSEFIGFAVGCFVDKEFPAPRFEQQRQYAHHWVPECSQATTFDDFGDPAIIRAGL